MASVDWATVDIDQLEQEWQAELDKSCEETIDGLNAAANASRALLPLIDSTSESLSALHEQYAHYSKQLEQMAAAVNVIQDINTGLSCQSRNQRLLFKQLEELLEKSNLEKVKSLEQEIIQNLDHPNQVNSVKEALEDLLQATRKSEDGELASMRAVCEQREAANRVKDKISLQMVNYFSNVFLGFTKGNASVNWKIGLTSEQFSFLRIYQPLFVGLQELDQKRYAECVATLQIHLTNHLNQNLKDLMEAMKRDQLINASLIPSFTNTTTGSLNSPSLGFLIDYGSQGHVEQPKLEKSKISPSKFNTAKALDIASPLPNPCQDRHALPFYQGFHYLIVHLLWYLDGLYGVLNQSFPPSADKIMHSLLTQPSIAQQMATWCVANELISIEMLICLEERLNGVKDLGKPYLLDFLKQLIVNFKRLADQACHNQLQQIKESFKGVSVKRRREDVLPSVKTFCNLIDYYTLIFDFELAKNSTLNKVLFEGILSMIVKQLDSINTVTREDEKDQVNAAVLLIENSHHLSTHLKGKDTVCEQLYIRAISKYIDLHKSKIVGSELAAFLDLLQKEAAAAQSTNLSNIMFKSQFSKSTARRVMASGLASRDVKSGFEYCRQRVHKHFPKLANHVWREFESGMQRWGRECKATLEKVYGLDADLPFLSVLDFKL